MSNHQSAEHDAIPEVAWVIEVRSPTGWWLAVDARPTWNGALTRMEELQNSDPICHFRVERYVHSRPGGSNG